MSEGMGFLAVGADELGARIRKGDTIEHRHPDGTWEAATIEYGEKVLEDGSKVESDVLAFYKLKDGNAYLAGLGGKLLHRANLRLCTADPWIHFRAKVDAPTACGHTPGPGRSMTSARAWKVVTCPKCREAP